MIDTEISKINNNNCEKIIIKSNNKLLIFSPEDPNKERRRWPAIIFAVKRTAKVMGRINKLIDSIITIKGIKIVGVPCGVKCEKKSLM
jgi:hypothetical protein